ncbi:nuclear transport factor 2 family protein [Agrobacterium sp.]|uniref:nuclear transport factor 2 family protein n=1 Tax=Agrobacterium sp. TaxID=361 RepID=UPI0028A8973B|nr:nuclear transport factor 2 family protein [Agrobacterium sp.]
MFGKIRTIATATAVCLLMPATGIAAEVRTGVTFAGEVEKNAGRATMQNLIFDLASAWASCNANLMKNTVTEDVEFSYPTNHVSGRDKMLEDLAQFCKNAKDTSIYLPADAFFIDMEKGRIAVELQFRTFQRGNRQVVNDVWIAHVKNGKISIIKEYLDGRVKDLQALGVLQLEESPETLTPWPPRTEQWKGCFPVVKAAPTNTCP